MRLLRDSVILLSRSPLTLPTTLPPASSTLRMFRGAVRSIQRTIRQLTQPPLISYPTSLSPRRTAVILVKDRSAPLTQSPSRTPAAQIPAALLRSQTVCLLD